MPFGFCFIFNKKYRLYEGIACYMQKFDRFMNGIRHEDDILPLCDKKYDRLLEIQ